jgi:transcriptional regulator with XRE-family HTH domain
MSTPNPLLQRRRLRAELRSLRLDARLTQEQVASTLDWSLSKLIRIESGSVGISPIDLRVLLQVYGVEDHARVGELLELARGARERPWWSRYQDLLSNADITYIEYESSATVIRQFHTMLIPSLLQTEDYARALLANDLQISTDYVAARISALTEQQALLDRVDPPLLKAVLDEAVIRRLIGGPDTMRRQLEHLLDVVRRHPNISLQVLPFEAGATPALQGWFVYLEFADYADDIVWTENSYGRSVDGDADRTAQYLETFMQIERLALEPTGSSAMLERMIQDLSGTDTSTGPTLPDPEDYLDQHFVL